MNDNTAEAEHNIYNLNEIEYEKPKGANISDLCQNEQGIYGLQSVHSDDAPNIYSIIAISGEKAGKEITLETDEGAWFNSLAADNDGNFYVIERVYNTTQDIDIESELDEEDTDADADVSEEDTDSNEAISEETFHDASDNKQYIVKFSPLGDVIWKTLVEEEINENYYGLEELVYVENVGAVASSSKGITVFDTDSGEAESINSEFVKDYSSERFSRRHIIALRDGNLYLIDGNMTGEASFYKYDTSKENFVDFSDKVPIDILEGHSIYPGIRFDFLINQYDGLYGLNIGDNEASIICDYLSSDITDNFGIRYFFEEDDENIFVAVNDQNYYGVDFSRLTKARLDEIQQKTQITVAAYFASDSMRRAVADFNKANDEYRIVLKDYGDYVRNEGVDGLEKLDLDIVSGEVPDIIELGQMISIDKYLNKGFFEPLDDYFAEDKELSSGEYLQNVLDCGKKKDKLYTLIPQFTIYTGIASADLMNGETLDWSNYKEICEKRNIDPALLFGVYSRDVAYDFYSIAAEECIDREHGTCNFKNQSFYNLLEYVKLLPEECDDSSSASLYREKKAILYFLDVYNMDEYVFAKEGYFGCDVVYNGIPGLLGGTSYIKPTTQLAMSSNCKYKDAAWQFMRYFLTDDYQDNMEFYLPVSQKAFTAILEKAQENPYYIDENGEKHEMSSYVSMDDIEVEIKAISAVEAKQFEDLVKSITTLYEEDEAICSIISEEAEAFYAGQKSVEEVANIIQSRVSLYISENS
jgi:ABC-type glycerol-3-phosphate transport system substrate-binding protein